VDVTRGSGVGADGQHRLFCADATPAELLDDAITRVQTAVVPERFYAWARETGRVNTIAPPS
jgi:hypothetical protein